VISVTDLAFNFIRMNKIVLLALLLISLNASGQKDKSYHCSWHTEGSEELSISSESYTYSEKGKLFYFLSNDENKIILDMKVEDEGIQNRILKEGMTIWINMDGKQDKKMGVRFPIGSQYQAGGKSNLTTLNPDGTVVTPLSMANTIELTGFTGENSNRLPSENYDSFNGFVNYDKEGILHYRMNFPFEKIPLRNSKEGGGAMPFNFGIEYGMAPSANIHTPPPSSRQQGGVPPKGGGSGKSGGSRGGGMPPGTMPVSGSGGNEPPKPSVLHWVKNITLSVKK
jgi:hypothetical protein